MGNDPARGIALVLKRQARHGTKGGWERPAHAWAGPGVASPEVRSTGRVARAAVPDALQRSRAREQRNGLEGSARERTGRRHADHVRRNDPFLPTAKVATREVSPEEERRDGHKEEGRTGRECQIWGTWTSTEAKRARRRGKSIRVWLHRQRVIIHSVAD